LSAGHQKVIRLSCPTATHPDPFALS
jgi:hypothetical protein